jgi:hypothetical protein
MTRNGFLLGLLILFAACAARAEDQPKDPRVTDALSLFGEGCVKQAGRIDQIATWALLHELREMEADQSAFFLRGQKGTVWSAPAESGSYALIARQPTSCSVWAYRGNAREATEWFEKLLRKSLHKSDQIENMTDRNFEGAGGNYRLLGWRVRGDGAALMFTITVTEAESDEVPAQVIVSVSPVADDDASPHTEQ